MKEEIQRLIRELENRRQWLDSLILRTATGPDREKLTEANILMMKALETLTEVA